VAALIDKRPAAMVEAVLIVRRPPPTAVEAVLIVRRPPLAVEEAIVIPPLAVVVERAIMPPTKPATTAAIYSAAAVATECFTQVSALPLVVAGIRVGLCRQIFPLTRISNPCAGVSEVALVLARERQLQGLYYR
jgi:hypothetical protein